MDNSRHILLLFMYALTMYWTPQITAYFIIR